MLSVDKREKVKSFNGLLESLLIQMSPLIGTSYHNKFMMIIKVNAILPIQEFLLQATPVRDKILNRDESYFETDNAVSNLVDVETKYINNILKLQNIYSQLDKTSRDNVWQIFQCMLILAEEWVKL
jgi:hypothetical protein